MIKTPEPGQTFFFLGSKITADGDCSHQVKRCWLLGRKVMTNLDSILTSRNITLPTKGRLVKAMVSPGVIYGCVCVFKQGVYDLLSHELDNSVLLLFT